MEDLTRRHGEITTRWVRGVGTHHRIHEVALIDLSDEVLTILSPLTGGQDEVTRARTGWDLLGATIRRTRRFRMFERTLIHGFRDCHEWTT